MDLTLGKLWVMDVEGNGATPPEIIELAIVEIANLSIMPRHWQWLVRPESPILPAATRIHGLADDDVADAPSIDDISGDIMTWTDGATIVGHNVKIELDIISRSIPDWKPAAAIDTLKLARTLKPGLESYGLEKLGVLMGHSEEAAQRSGKRHHSALYDTILTALIFIDLMSALPVELRSDALMSADILASRQGILL
ncbi:3'-5' exonuclease [Mesorhizobium temperatum]|uniref:3'-5' exonuclease n=1 Tax=Mesorhizobium temperatum TaxID=241416 RepID=UPI001FD9E610|nr:3'-5' exonuclease [Mesorhizobium temperatum]